MTSGLHSEFVTAQDLRKALEPEFFIPETNQFPRTGAIHR
jgi:hypothetical protein